MGEWSPWVLGLAHEAVGDDRRGRSRPLGLGQQSLALRSSVTMPLSKGRAVGS